MRKVGDGLGNTAAVARASYVSPAVVEHYRAGRTLAHFRSVNGAGPSWLTATEVALLELLQTPVDAKRERFAGRGHGYFRRRARKPRR